LLECLLSLDQAVVGLDNFSTGHPKNIDEALEHGGVSARFRLIYGDVCSLSTCREACSGVDIVLHQAALGSVPRSIDDPLESHASNVNGFVNMLVAAREAKVQRFVYASSCAVYGDDFGFPKREERTGEALSPYAATKLIDEIYASTFQRVYGLETVGLRYFNIFGRRQDPNGSYSAVIPRWVSALLARRPCVINGDGETSRDFCHVDNVVQANLLAATSRDASAPGQVYNVASGRQTTLNELYPIIRDKLREQSADLDAPAIPGYADFRPGDVRHSVADISKVSKHLGYYPRRQLEDGIVEAIHWYMANDTLPKPPRRVSLHDSGPPPLHIVTPQDIV
jgi:UDP-N-acetylglucosamine/UDP-N-acetylgalactosamine 4-epimerase